MQTQTLIIPMMKWISKMVKVRKLTRMIQEKRSSLIFTLRPLTKMRRTLVTRTDIYGVFTALVRRKLQEPGKLVTKKLKLLNKQMIKKSKFS
jgi:hypothetical protein